MAFLVVWLFVSKSHMVRKAPPTTPATAPAAPTQPPPPPASVPARVAPRLLSRIQSLTQKAAAAMAENEPAAAERSYREILGLLNQGGPALSRWKATTRLDLARCLLRQGKQEEAKTELTIVLAEEKQSGRPASPALAQAFRLLGQIFLRQGDKDRALAHFTQARDIYVSLSGPDSRQSREMDRAIAEIGPATKSPAPPADNKKGDAETVWVFPYRDFSPSEKNATGRWNQSAALLSDKAPGDLRELPPFRGKSQLYGVLRLGTGTPGTFDLVFDVTDEIHPLLYVDLNQNKDLSDDGGPIRNQGTGVFAARIVFDLLRVMPELGKKGSYPIWLFSGGGYWASGKVNFYSLVRLEGTVRLDQKAYAASISEWGLNDGNFLNDGIFVDLNSNGSFELSEYAAPDKTLTTNGRAYRFMMVK
ncbi:MAG: tetratricopeptide repeat protein [Thermodesulfobacteriota bacterium]